MSIIYGNLNSDVIRGAINESCIELTINNFMQENVLFDSLLESADLELVQEKVDFKKIISKIIEAFKKLIEKVKKLTNKIISKIKSRSKANKSDTEGYVEYRDIVFVYKGREFPLKDIKSVITLFEKDLGLFDNTLFKIINGEEKNMEDELDKYVEKYGSDATSPRNDDITIKEKMVKVKSSEYNYDALNKDFEDAKKYLFEKSEELYKDLQKTLPYIEKLGNNMSDVADKLNEVNTLKAKAARKILTSKNFLTNYYAQIGVKLFKIATSAPSIED